MATAPLHNTHAAHLQSSRQRPATPPLDALRRLITTTDNQHETLGVFAPFDGQRIGSVPQCTAADVTLALTRARAAQPAWAATTPAQRRRIMLRFHDLLLQHTETLLDLVQLESGKAREHALEEVLDVPHKARHYAIHSRRILRSTVVKSPIPVLTRTAVHRRPVGVVAIIAPWNYPLAMAVTDAIPALMAGNTVVLKPSELTPFSALYALQLLQQAGLPAHVMQIVTGCGQPIGATLIAGCDALCFTGSVATGQRVAALAGQHLKAAALELGGKNPMLVLDNANLGAAVRSAVASSFSNAGQLCLAIERIYVQRGVYARFVQEMVAATRRLRLGASYDYSANIGSLIGADQLEKTRAHVDDALRQGATLQAGGRHRPDIGPYFYEPTILTDVTPTMAVYQHETFGPVVSIYPVDTPDEAVQLANDSPYGLNASVWSRDIAQAMRIAARLQCGTVNINEGYRSTWAAQGAPMGGVKQSGMGRRGGDEGLLRFTETQAISVQRLMSLGGPPWMSRRVYSHLMRGLMRVCRITPGWR